MPIKPENRALYPANWKTEIRPRILERAGNCCERCKVPNRARVFRFVEDGEAFYQFPDDGRVFDAVSGAFVAWARVVDLPAGRYVDIVLTIAHLHDHNPANCTDENLAALCQKCHLDHDRPMHQKNSAATRRAKSPTGDMFGEVIHESGR
jgi:hypothetical protein